MLRVAVVFQPIYLYYHVVRCCGRIFSNENLPFTIKCLFICSVQIMSTIILILNTCILFIMEHQVVEIHNFI